MIVYNNVNSFLQSGHYAYSMRVRELVERCLAWVRRLDGEYEEVLGDVRR